jgi:N-acyl-D-amino-acid deacylase
MARPALALWLVLVGGAARAHDADAVRTAVERGLKRLDQGSANYVTNRQCFSCHHQALTIAALRSAQQRGIRIDPERLGQQVEFTLATFRPRKQQVARGQGVGGANATVAYALFTLEAAGHAPDDTTAALVEFLLRTQRPNGAWPPVTNRPPSEGSTFVNNALALRALRAFGPPQDVTEADPLSRRVDAAFERGRDWLLKNRPVTTEDKWAHLRGLVEAGAEAKLVAEARDALLKEQRPDGSWAQLPNRDGDAYATGAVLMALRRAGVAADADAYRKGVEFLVNTQRTDGAWIVETRSKPIQIYFDNGDPGGRSQFISFAATGWAVLALLETVNAAPAKP